MTRNQNEIIYIEDDNQSENDSFDRNIYKKTGTAKTNKSTVENKRIKREDDIKREYINYFKRFEKELKCLNKKFLSLKYKIFPKKAHKRNKLSEVAFVNSNDSDSFDEVQKSLNSLQEEEDTEKTEDIKEDLTEQKENTISDKDYVPPSSSSNQNNNTFLGRKSKYEDYLNTIKNGDNSNKKNINGSVVKVIKNANNSNTEDNEDKGNDYNKEMTYDEILQQRYQRNRNNRQRYLFSSNLPRKKFREKLSGYKCELCSKFYNALGEDNYICNECSRHRTNYKPTSTPDGFYDLDI